MSFWDKVQAAGKSAGDATKLAAHKTKLRTDMMMIDRDIQNRKKVFGVAMYDHVAPLSQSSDFYAATDDLTIMLRPPVINAQKEINALAAKRIKLKENLAAAEVKRAASFPIKAETYGQKFMNFGKAGVMHSGETKIKAELAVVDRQIKGHKQNFGLELFATMSEAEDIRGFLPSDRQVRNIYDQARGDIHTLVARKQQKEEELIKLGGTPSTPVGNNTGTPQTPQSNPHDLTSDLSMQSSYYENQNSAQQNGYTDTTPNSADQMEDLLL